MISPSYAAASHMIVHIADCLGVDPAPMRSTFNAFYFDKARRHGVDLADRWADQLNVDLDKYVSAFTTGGTIIDPKRKRPGVYYANMLSQTLALIYTDTATPLAERTAAAQYVGVTYVRFLTAHGAIAAFKYGFDTCLSYGIKGTVPTAPPLLPIPHNDNDGDVA